jgi:hypothetical protein
MKNCRGGLPLIGEETATQNRVNLVFAAILVVTIVSLWIAFA